MEDMDKKAFEENEEFNEHINAYQSDENKPGHTKKKINGNLIFKVVIIVLLVVSLGCNGFLMYKVLGTSSSNGSTSNNKVQTINYDVKTDLTDVIKKAKESTVGVAVYQNNKLSGSGSGVIYKVNGKTVYVITNHHVIDSAQSIEVIYSNGESVKAELVGSDQYGDIAVLKMNVNFDVTAFKTGDSDLLDPGETVMAVGSPLGIEYAGTVTQGIVSAAKRTVSVDLNGDGKEDWDMNVIQTDAAINPGNSGGALVNAVGELVGITSMKYSSEEVEGMGFAIPISKAQEILNNLMTKKTREAVDESAQGYLGIQGTNIDANASKEYGMPVGIYVYKIVEGGAAANSDLKEKDIITKFDGQSVTNMEELKQMLTYYEGGSTVELTVQSLVNGAYVEHNVQITLGTKPASNS